jgi:hypothetical protein
MIRFIARFFCPLKALQLAQHIDLTRLYGVRVDAIYPGETKFYMWITFHLTKLTARF